MLKAKRLGIIGGVLAGSLVLAASASALPLESHVGITYGIPDDSAEDNYFTLEVGAEYTHETGAYAGVLLTTNNLLESDDDSDNVELSIGYAGEFGSIGYDLGFLKTYFLDSDIEDEEGSDEIYLGILFAPTDELGLSAYYFHDLDSDVDGYVELGAEYDLGFAVASYLYTHGLSDNKTQESEIGISKEIIDSHELGLTFFYDHDESEFLGVELTWTYSF
ncbi:hypothetical protein LGV61_12750 [Desulfurispirillum indicum]|uniref:TorF family putative porin n=1 Tax=Desulfurispirillum indicum TaxID=936456 RepID=UPI001CFBDFAA|nr:TorF family putative porin [Desulfurispirillum indicum]UCZ56579.1 hypothetical protein LGV61_12750 [Desulfurispirillum indicum]